MMGKARILIVEDETVIALGIEGKLQSLGYEGTSIVNTGEKAIEKAESEKPDLIIMDIRLKGEMDGIDAAEVIRNKFGIPVIFSTAYLDQERIERAKITMPFGYLLKPIQERDLKVTLEMALYVAKADAERRKTEEELNQMNKFLIKAQKISNMGSWIWDLKSGDMVWTDQVYEIFGLDKQIFIPNINSVMERVHPDDQKMHEKLIDVALNNREQHDFEAKIVRPTGEERFIFSTSEGEYADDGTLISITGILQDITDKKQTEQTIYVGNKRLEQAHKLIKIGHWDWFMDTGELVWSDEVYEIFGKDKESFEVSAESFEKTIHPDDFDAFVAEREKALIEERDVDIEHRIIQPDGSVRHVHEIAEIIRDEKGEVIRVMGVVQDITERIELHNKIIISERLYRKIFYSCPDGIVLGEIDGTIYDGNPAYCKQLGYSSLDELKKKNFRELTPEKWHEYEEKILVKALKDGVPQYFEKEYTKKDGTIYPVGITSWAILDEGGNPAKIGAFVRELDNSKQI
jgi:PAS domain S-box-containing protein